MGRVVALALAILVGAACGAGVRWERPGGTGAERKRDETGCAGLANRDRSVPVQGGTMGSTSRRGQDSLELATVRGIDSGVFDECMKARGYQRVPSQPPG